MARGQADATRLQVLIQQHPGAAEPVVALRTDGVLDFGRQALRRLNVLLAAAAQLLGE